MNPRGAGDRFGLWRTDGTEQGFIRTSPVDYDWYDTTYLTDIDGALYCHSNQDKILAKSGATTGSAEILSDSIYLVSGFTGFNGKVIFSAKPTEQDYDSTVWVTDGTSAGTGPMLSPGSEHPLVFAGGYTVIGNQVWFSALDKNDDARTIWITDGTEGGTHGIPFLDPTVADEPAPVTPSRFFAFNTRSISLAASPTRGNHSRRFIGPMGHREEQCGFRADSIPRIAASWAARFCLIARRRGMAAIRNYGIRTVVMAEHLC